MGGPLSDVSRTSSQAICQMLPSSRGSSPDSTGSFCDCRRSAAQMRCRHHRHYPRAPPVPSSAFANSCLFYPTILLLLVILEILEILLLASLCLSTLYLIALTSVHQLFLCRSLHM